MAKLKVQRDLDIRHKFDYVSLQPLVMQFILLQSFSFKLLKSASLAV